VESTRVRHSGPTEEEQHDELGDFSAEDAQALDLNHATVEQLAAVDEIGLEMAETIVQQRVHQGHFLRWEDLHKVPGLSMSQLQALQRAARIADPQAQG